MPPKVKVTKEEIIAAALEILRQKGMEAVNARAVAAALGCSTQPIFSNYSSMGALQHDVLAAGYAEYNRWIEQQMKEGRYPPYKASGMAYIQLCPPAVPALQGAFYAGQDRRAAARGG